MGRLSVLSCAIAASSLLCLYEPAEAASITYRCMNTASQATWDVKVDYDQATAESYPADITASRIRWENKKEGGTYSLDRKSGDLTFAVASSTGGALWFHKCHEE